MTAVLTSPYFWLCAIPAAAATLLLAWGALDRWIDRRLAVDVTPEADVEWLPEFEAALRTIRERGATVASDDSWLRGIRT